MSDERLSTFFQFDDSELLLNQNGRLSEKQKKRLISEENASKGCNLILGVFLLLVALLGVGIAVSVIMASGEEDRAFALIFLGGFGIIWPLIWGLIGLFSVRRAFAKVQVQVKGVQGSINIVKTIRESYNSDSHTTSHYTVYELRVGGRTFEVGSGLADLMMQGDAYAIYYADFNLADKDKEILSVEKLDHFTPSPEAAASDDVEVVEHLKKNDLIGAIKAYRALHGAGLADAKQAVEEIQARLGSA